MLSNPAYVCIEYQVKQYRYNYSDSQGTNKQEESGFEWGFLTPIDMGCCFGFTILLVLSMQVFISATQGECITGRADCILSGRFCINDDDCCSGRCYKWYARFIGLCRPCVSDGSECENDEDCCGGSCFGTTVKTCTTKRICSFKGQKCRHSRQCCNERLRCRKGRCR